MPEPERTDRVSVYVRLSTAADQAIDERAAKLGDLTRSAVVEQAIARAPEDGPPLVAGGVPDGLPSDLLERRPDVRQAQATLAAAGARIDVARAAYFPSLSLTGTLGKESRDLSQLLDGPSTIFSVLASLTQPIWNAGALVLILWVERRFRQSLKPGDSALLYGVLYSAGRFFTEGLRTDSLCVGPYTLDGSCAGGLRIAQLVSLAAVVTCGLILAWRHRHSAGHGGEPVGTSGELGLTE